MSGEPQPTRDHLDRSVFGLSVVWLGLVLGGLVTVIMFASIVWTGGGGVARLGSYRYLFLLPVPFGLLVAYLMVPRLVRSDPATVVRSGRSQGTIFEGWEGTTPDDAYYWFPLYMTRFLVRAALLEGTAIIVALGFFITGDWILLGGAAVMLAALIVEKPSRTAVESFADTARMRRMSAE